MELRKHIVDLKDQQEDSIGGAHRSRLRKAVAAPILTPFGRPGVEESPHSVTYVGIPMFSKHNEFWWALSTHWNYVSSIPQTSPKPDFAVIALFLTYNFHRPRFLHRQRPVIQALTLSPWQAVNHDRQGSYFMLSIANSRTVSEGYLYKVGSTIKRLMTLKVKVLLAGLLQIWQLWKSGCCAAGIIIIINTRALLGFRH